MKKAFTLIELLVVIAIIGGLSALLARTIWERGKELVTPREKMT